MASVRGACEALGAVTLLSEMGYEVKARLHVDASVALGIMQRKGGGQVRHLSVGVLWLQEQQLRKAVEMLKIHGPKDPADLMTKGMSREAIAQHLCRMCIEFREGRAHSAVQLHHLRRRERVARAIAKKGQLPH